VQTYQVEYSGRLETLTLALQAAETAVQQVQVIEYGCCACNMIQALAYCIALVRLLESR
jgi:hypothetical protein